MYIYRKIGRRLYGPRNGEVLFRYDPVGDRILKYREEIAQYDFSNTSWNSNRLKQTGVTCVVPAGEFNNCLNLQFGKTRSELDAYACGEYLATDIGNVKYVIPGVEFPDQSEGDFATFELQGYTIIPESMTLLLLGFGALLLRK